ncbi:hypothetical protein [Stenotrophomonas sp. MMGLT7]|uniref:hypothetical protein n=1 Tax=Stenotrophomonas sp. MMGLT7 TaxID=2901227 RepID=UPI001E5FF146|nr:hypothetical protein [Stenotrophomonas sp. MMGLT7]MCD7097644.1 hypothetical protein [Stenotrophomonas sp. MMGLT7]
MFPCRSTQAWFAATDAGASGPEANYLQVDYARRYAGLLRLHPERAVAIAELCLFRFWLTCCVHCHGCLHTADAMPVVLPPRDWPLPLRADGYEIERVLGGWIGSLVESRFDLYDRFFTLGRRDDDPQGIKAVSLALACQLFAEPTPAIVSMIEAETRQLFQAQVLAGSVTTRAPVVEPADPAGAVDPA